MIVTRRALLIGAAAGLLEARSRAAAVAFNVPPGACDCHTHVFADPAEFPFWTGRTLNSAPENR
jgi:hypothetical protein